MAKRNKRISAPVYQNGDTNVTAGVGTSGVGITGTKPIGENSTANVGIGSNYSGGVGVNAGVATELGSDTTASVGAGVGPSGPSAGVGVNHQVNDNISVGGNVGIGPTGPGAGVGVGYQTEIGGNSTLESNATVGTGGVGMYNTVTVGNTPEASVAADVGGAVGTALMFGADSGTFSSAAGSAIGSALSDTWTSWQAKEGAERRGLYKGFESAGLFEGGVITNPDGSVFDVKGDTTNHDRQWTNPDLRQDDAGDRGLFDFETDYTNDLDYIAGTAGISLSRLIVGDSGKSIDQTGGLMGNAFLASTGYGKPMTEENFNKVITNARAMYKKGGVDSKEEMLALSDKMLADGRLNEMEHHQMLTTADIVFDGNYNEASKSLAGRHDGVKSATKTPSAEAANKSETKGAGVLDVPTGMSNDARNRPGRVYGSGGILSPEEVMMTVQPLIDIYDQRKAEGAASKKPGFADNLAMATGLYGLINKATGGQLNGILKELVNSGVSGAKEVYDELKDYFNDDSTVSGDDIQYDGPVDSEGNPTYDLNDDAFGGSYDQGSSDYGNIDGSGNYDYNLDDSAFSSDYSGSTDDGGFF